MEENWQETEPETDQKFSPSPAAALKLTETVWTNSMKTFDRTPQNPPLRCLWQFSKNPGEASLINTFRISSFVLSVPGSSAFVGRIFSPTTVQWSDSRNGCSTGPIKNEPQLSVSCDLSCRDISLAVQNMLMENADLVSHSPLFPFHMFFALKIQIVIFFPHLFCGLFK